MKMIITDAGLVVALRECGGGVGQLARSAQRWFPISYHAW